MMDTTYPYEATTVSICVSSAPFPVLPGALRRVQVSAIRGDEDLSASTVTYQMRYQGESELIEQVLLPDSCCSAMPWTAHVPADRIGGLWLYPAALVDFTAIVSGGSHGSEAFTPALLNVEQITCSPDACTPCEASCTPTSDSPPDPLPA